MSAILEFICSLTGLMLSVGAVAIWLHRRPASARGRRALAAILAAYFLASAYVVPFALTRLLTRGLQPFSRADAQARRTAIVVLGSGAAVATDWDQRSVSYADLASGIRIAEAARVFRLVPDGWIISSGGTVSGGETGPTTSETMRDALVSLGVPAGRILVETRSQSTHEEAVFVAPMLRSLSADRVVLVTADYHMWRSLRTFRAAGIDATPAIARDPMAGASWWRWLQPTPLALRFTSSALHEFVAIALYAARGWLR
jgi:uncharacterized SAM-binding protein YcdF (DUF218 family)